jgi:lipoprotein-anchoring transpeptidase ErfK/SrfK
VSKSGRPAGLVGNDFFVPRPRLQTATPQITPKPAISIPVVSNIPVETHFEQYNFEVAVRPKVYARKQRFTRWQQVVDFAHDYSLGVFAVMFLMVGSISTQIYSSYASAQIIQNAPVIAQPNRSGKPIAGLNMQVPSSQLASSVSTIASQNISLAIGDKSETLSQDSLRSWLQVVTDNKTNTSYIHVKDTAITASLQDLAKKYTKSAVNQVSVDHDGTTSIIATGKNGLNVSVPADLAKDIAKNVLAGKGMQLSLPTETVPFQAVTPVAFDKLIEVNVVTKQMYLYQNGQLYKSYPISAGAPETPTPIGQFKTFSKLASQDMRGYNANGTKYFQPHVHWISYFLPGGYAIHGNYWRPQSWFGNINSSHGCVSLPDAQAKEVYDWTPVGTTIITHY